MTSAESLLDWHPTVATASSRAKPATAGVITRRILAEVLWQCMLEGRITCWFSSPSAFDLSRLLMAYRGSEAARPLPAARDRRSCEADQAESRHPSCRH